LRVLLVTGNFVGPERQPWLLDDLANALVQHGHEVDVLLADATCPRPRGEQAGTEGQLTVFSVGTTRRRTTTTAKLLGYLSIGYRLHTMGYSWVKRHRYDLCLYTTIACFTWGLPSRVRRRSIARRSLFFLWDFFPIHQVEIGRIRSTWLTEIMRVIERRAFDDADFVALMSPANTRFFHEYHAGASNMTVEIPPWSSPALPNSESKGDDSLKCVFGGQLAKGRGLDALLNCAELLLNLGCNVQILIAGDGPERHRLEKSAGLRGLNNVLFLGALPRDKYRTLAQSAHVGIAVTVPGVSPPTFPSKIVEYCRLGLPVLVCTEAASDAGEIVATNGAGFSVPAGDAAAMANALRSLRAAQCKGELEQMASAATQLFNRYFSVERVVERLEALGRE
jgi:glycosyltransferase involved in cell wall biosynthesis